MLKKLVFFLLIAAALTALPIWPLGTEATRPHSQKELGHVLPELKAKTLDGKELTLPLKNGKATLLGVAFSTKAEQDLKGWLQPIYDAFLAKHEGVFEAGNFDGNVYLVAMMPGAGALVTKGIRDKAAKNIDADLKPHLLLTTQESSTIAKALNVTDKSRPYFAVLDTAGHIKSVVSGAYNEAKMDQLSDNVSAAE